MDGAAQSPEGSLAVARQSFYAVYILFRTEEEAAAWEAGLPPQPEEGPGWEVLPSTALRDDRGGYYEGVFRKVTGYNPDAIAAMIRTVPDRCYEPRKDGFVWSDMAALAKGNPEKLSMGYVALRDAEDIAGGVGVVGVGAGGGAEH